MEDRDAGARWGEFEIEAEELAADIKRLITQYGFALMGTIRRDGTPRISPVETHLIDRDLVLVMIPRTRKAADVRRDGRLTLQSPVMDAGDPGAEYKLRGRALTLREAQTQKSVADILESRSGWRPRPSWLFVAIALTDAVHTVWNQDGTAMMKSWTRGAMVQTRHLALDMDFGGYRKS